MLKRERLEPNYDNVFLKSDNIQTYLKSAGNISKANREKVSRYPHFGLRLVLS